MQEIEGARDVKPVEFKKLVICCTDGDIMLNGPYPYPIAWDRINTPQKLVHWLLHLSEKQWFSTEMLRQLILLVCGIDGINGQLGRLYHKLQGVDPHKG